MFFILTSTWQFILLAIGLLAFGYLAWRRPVLGFGLVLFFCPLYLLKIGNWPFTVLDALVLIIAAVFFLKKKGRFYWPEKKFLIPIILLLAGASLSTIFSPDIRTSLGVLKSWFFEPALFAFVGLNILKDKQQLKIVLSCLAASGSVVALAALGWLAFDDLTFDGRLSAFYLSPNHLAMYLAPTFIVALGLIILERDFWRRVVWAVGAFLMFGAIFFSFSYGAWLAILAAGALVFLMAWWKAVLRVDRKVAITCSLALLLFLAAGVSQMNSEKLNNLLNSDRSSWQSRLIVWRVSGKMISENPMLGIGPGVFQQKYLEYQKYYPPYLEWAVPQPHNLFLAFWLQAGLLGLVGFVWLMAVTLYDIWKNAKNRSLVLILGAVVVYFLLHGLVDTIYWKNDLALIFWAIIALGYKANRLAD